MRWADIDMLHHVNNVTYVEYAAEALALLVGEDAVRADPPGEVSVTFLKPILLSHQPIVVSTVLDGDTLTQEIRSGDDSDPAARIVSRWGSYEGVPLPDGAEGPIDVRVRVGDSAGDGLVTVPKMFELCQESRIRLISQRLNDDAFGRFVVGTVTVRVHGPVTWRVQPYQSHGWLGRFGEGSFTIHTVMTDRGRPLLSGTSVLVGFDLDTQRSRRFTDEERAAMADLLVD